MLRVVLVVVPQTLLISERYNSINYPFGTAISNSYAKQSYTGLPKRAQDLKQMKFCPILANFFFFANLSTIWNTFTVLNNAVVAQNRQISGMSATL